jgi:hypothetical protein
LCLSSLRIKLRRTRVRGILSYMSFLQTSKKEDKLGTSLLNAGKTFTIKGYAY